MFKSTCSVFIIGILLMAFILDGCSPKTAPVLTDKKKLPDSLNEISFSKHLDISVGFWNIEDMEKASKPDPLTQYVEELFNITLHPVSVTWSNYKQRYQILSATDSLPDIFATLTISSNHTNDSAVFTNMIETGSIRPLPEDLSTYPVLNDLLKSVSYTKYKDGQYYAIPRFSITEPILSATDAAMLVRRDWMDNLGIQDPESIDDFIDMTIAFVTEDPDGNGVHDTLGYNVNNVSVLGKWVILGIAPSCNLFSWVLEEERFVPTWLTDSFIQVVKIYHRLYQSGGLDPDFFSKSPVTVMEDFASGRLGALEYKSSPGALLEIREKWDALNDKPFEECVDVLPIFPAPDGVRYSNSSNAFWSESFVSSSVTDEKLERILALFEFLLSEEGQELCLYGLEGIDYKREEDGSYQHILDVKTDSLVTGLIKKYPSVHLFRNLAAWGGTSWKDFEDNPLNRRLYGASCIQLGRKSVMWYQENTRQITRPDPFLLFPKEPSDKFSTSQAFDSFIRTIIQEDDPIPLWNELIAQMKAEGLDEYIDRQNENYKKERYYREPLK